MQTITPQPTHRTLMQDIRLGAVQGDFAQDMGGAGRLTQVVFGFIPGLGSLCAVRDFVADMQQHDHVGAVLNVMAMFPVAGGGPKALAVFLRATRRMGKVFRAARALNTPVPIDRSKISSIQENPQQPKRIP